uniref:AlNc14C330G10676 protein n=1 Tax=Albugo laibachii Nc14 TaxID=890382 RepID=F0WWR2_9STRA|nr:AlNc14C330G10676 [Albugo laibachii Nc14]|eukprot:CCA25889.1 AlNc14C330G10676 [Albugo laibachii Nc14]
MQCGENSAEKTHVSHTSKISAFHILFKYDFDVVHIKTSFMKFPSLTKSTNRLRTTTQGILSFHHANFRQNA